MNQLAAVNLNDLFADSQQTIAGADLSAITREALRPTVEAASAGAAPTALAAANGLVSAMEGVDIASQKAAASAMGEVGDDSGPPLVLRPGKRPHPEAADGSVAPEMAAAAVLNLAAAPAGSAAPEMAVDAEALAAGPGAAAEDEDEEDEEAPPAADGVAMAEDLGGGHRCPKCGSDMVDRALGLRKRKTRKAAPKKAAGKKGGKRRSTEKAPKKRSSYRKDRKLSRRR